MDKEGKIFLFSKNVPFYIIRVSFFNCMNFIFPNILLLVFAALYIVTLLIVCIKIITENEVTNPSRTLAYLFVVISFPIFGMILYLSVGVNYRKRKLYRKKLEVDEKQFPHIE